jgi:hypothetical protein
VVVVAIETVGGVARDTGALLPREPSCAWARVGWAWMDSEDAAARSFSRNGRAGRPASARATSRCDRRTSATGSPGGRRTRSRLREPRRLASFEGGNEGREPQE